MGARSSAKPTTTMHMCNLNAHAMQQLYMMAVMAFCQRRKTAVQHTSFKLPPSPNVEYTFCSARS